MNIESTSLISPVRQGVSETEKMVTGVKEGYGPTISNHILNLIYLNHPRTYTVALAGYASFVCQNVNI